MIKTIINDEENLKKLFLEQFYKVHVYYPWLFLRSSHDGDDFTLSIIISWFPEKYDANRARAAKNYLISKISYEDLYKLTFPLLLRTMHS